MARFYRRRYYGNSGYYKKKQKTADSIAQIILGIVGLGIFYSVTKLGYKLQDAMTILYAVSAFVVIIALGALSWFIHRRYQHRQLWRQVALSGVDAMDGIKFEHYLAWLLENNGFQNVKVTPPSGDYGADLTAEKEGVPYVVQAKRYSNHSSVNKVGIEAVQAVVASKSFYKAKMSMVITNTFFTPQAHILAKSNECILIDRTELGEWMRNATPDQSRVEAMN